MFPLSAGQLAPRRLLQADEPSAATSEGPQTAVVFNFGICSDPVSCINVSQPFQEQTHAASGGEVPAGETVEALTPLICSDFEAAGARIFDAVNESLERAKQAVQAIRVAAGRCAKDAADAVTVSSLSGLLPGLLWVVHKKGSIAAVA